MQFGSHTSYKKNNGGTMRKLTPGQIYTASNKASSEIDYIIPLRWLGSERIAYKNGKSRVAPRSNRYESFVFLKSGKCSKESIWIGWFGEKNKKNT